MVYEVRYAVCTQQFPVISNVPDLGYSRPVLPVHRSAQSEPDPWWPVCLSVFTLYEGPLHRCRPRVSALSEDKVGLFFVILQFFVVVKWVNVRLSRTLRTLLISLDLIGKVAKWRFSFIFFWRRRIPGHVIASHSEPVLCCGYSEELRQVVSCSEGSVSFFYDPHASTTYYSFCFSDTGDISLRKVWISWLTKNKKSKQKKINKGMAKT